jgi:SAM-dependent methyltransferase
MANREMAELWNGPATASWVTTPDRYDRMLEDLGRRALDAAQLAAGDRVLDVGCGAGQLTREAARRVAPTGRVLGVDLSAPLVELARSRTDDPAVSYVVGDAQVDPVPDPPYDVVVSRFGVMFFDDPVAAFGNIRAATGDAGRLSVVVWQAAAANEWVLTAVAAILPHVGPPDLPPADAPGPFSLAEPDRIHSVLGAAGWVDVNVRPVETTVLLGTGDVDSVVRQYEDDLLGRLMLAKAEEDARGAARAALREALEPRMSAEGLRLGAAAWVVTASRG